MWGVIAASRVRESLPITIVNSSSIAITLADNVPTVLNIGFTPSPSNRLFVFTTSAQVRNIEVSGFTNIYTEGGGTSAKGWVSNHSTDEITVTSTNGPSTTRINVIEIANSTNYTYGGSNRQLSVLSLTSPSLNTIKNSLLLVPAFTQQSFVSVDNGFTVITESPVATSKGLLVGKYYSTIELNQFTTVTQSTEAIIRISSLLIF